MVVHGGQLNATRSVQAKVDAAGSAAPRNFALCEWKLSGLKLSDTTQIPFYMLTEILERNRLCWKPNHAAKDPISGRSPSGEVHRPGSMGIGVGGGPDEFPRKAIGVSINGLVWSAD